MARIRPAAIAGQFYEGSADALSASVARHMDAAAPPDGPAPKAIIAPHAGDIYSGGCAAEAYARLLPDAGAIERIVQAQRSTFFCPGCQPRARAGR